MRSRSKAREHALQMLYQIDIRHSEPHQVIDAFWDEFTPTEDVKVFAGQLVIGTIKHISEIDQLIAQHADNWELSRMAVIDRNILRMGSFELLFTEETPAKVCINEAIELAKRFGDAESGKFINGVLDAIHKAHARSNG